jgi:eukaryotic-like serine/threonine-protein kinase
VAATPSLIGRYRVEAMLGGGAMGVVYRAHDPEINRKVAIKLVRAELLQGDDRVSYLQRFRGEAQAAGRCSHPNIVTVHDLGVHEGNPFLAMEYVPGVNLASVLAKGVRLQPKAAASIILLVLDALACAHAAGIVHRDIKPANILLADHAAPDGARARHRVKVTDFGIARIDATRWTAVGDVVGTPSYMSPEQCRGGIIDARSDLFSTAAVLFELLAGVPPFAGQTYQEIVYRLLNEPIPELENQGCNGAPEMQGFFGRALARAPEARFASAADMAAALRVAVGTNAAGAASDLTIAASLSPVPGSAPGIFPPSLTNNPVDKLDIDDALLSPIERQLTQYVGPIAKLLVQSGIRKAGSMDALCELLAASISEEAERKRFLTDVRQRIQQHAGRRMLLATGQALTSASEVGSPTTRPAIPASELEATARDLARFAGPIATVLVSRAAKNVTSRRELRERLATHIADPVARVRFLGDGE